MWKKRLLQGMSGYRFLVFALFMLLSSGGLRAAGEDEYQKKKISLQATNETVEEVLNKIGKAADIRFFYNHSAFDFSKKITIDIKDQELRNIVLQVLSDYSVDIEYQLNHTVVLRPKTPMSSIGVQKVNGTVIDAKNGEALVGASIVLKEQRGVGVVTDVDGKFHVELIAGGATALVVSFIGYQTEEVKLPTTGNLENVTVKMTPVAAELEGVVVTGMAPRKVSGFTGRYVTVKGEELKRLNPNNLLQALSIFDPSFHVIENNQYGSDPNKLPEFRLRGDVQLGASDPTNFQMMMGDYSNRPNMPLFILDGFETSLQRIVDLDPERVESITILKDAAGTAMYGSKASNGVIVFETKKPKPGALTLNYSGNVGVSVPDLSDYNLMNASEKLEYERRAGLFSTTDMLNYYNRYKEEVLRGVNTYWLSQPLRTAVTHRHTLGIEGGDEAIRYSLGLNYGSEYGVMKGSDRTNVGLNLVLSYRRKKWNISNSLNMTNTDANNSPYGSFSEYTKLNPYYRLTDENGQYQNVIEMKPMAAGSNRVTITNPLYNTQFPYKDLTKNFSVVDNFSLEYAILDNLRVNGQVSFTKSHARSEQFKSSHHTDFAPEKVEDITQRGTYAKSIGESIGWSANASLNYNYVKGKHGLFALARWNVESSKSDGVNLSAKGFPDDNMTDFLFAFEMDRDVNGNESTNRSVGVLGSLNYMYDQRYSVDFNVHGDISSQFGSDTKMAPFWSVGVRWNMQREKWLAGTIISNLTLTANMGVTGSQSYSPYQAKETYSFTDLMFPYPGADVLGAQLMGIGNPALKWSKTKAKSVNLEVGLWNSRLNLSASYYHNYTDQMLLSTNIQPSTGFPTLTRNVGAVLNEGIDVTLNGLLISDYERQIQWSLGVNFTHNRNVIKKLSNELKEMNQNNLNNRNEILPIYEEGESTSVIKLVPSLGIDPATGEELFRKLNGEKTFVWDAADKIPVGDTEPKVRGTIPSSFMWKNLSVNLGFSFQWGADRFNQTLLDKIENSNISGNVDKRAGGADRWSPTNRYAKYKKISIEDQHTPTSTRFLQRYNEFAFTSVAIGYRFEPKYFKFLETCKIASLSLNASMQDIGRISTVKQERGLDYPFARSFNLSVSVLFN